MSNESEKQNREKYFFLLFLGFLVLIGAGLFLKTLYDGTDSSRILLNLSEQEPVVSGIVTFNGKPVSDGQVHVVFERDSDNVYIKSFRLPVHKDGTFESECNPLLILEKAATDNKQTGYRITASFVGQVSREGNATESVAAESIIYWNESAPYLQNEEGIFFIFSLVLLFILIILFTGEIGKTKSRLLFSMMYFMTFMSLFVPIAITVWVSQDDRAVELMEKSPIGLIRASAKGISEPQWLVNIGGRIVTEQSHPDPEATKTQGYRINKR